MAIGPNEPIRIDTVLETSGGPSARLGRDALKGAHLAADFLSPPGELLGHKVEWADHDDMCEGEDAVFPQDAKMIAVIGTTCSHTAFGIADAIYSERGIVLISPSNTSPGLTDPKARNSFYLRTAHNDVAQGAAVAEFVSGFRRAATIHDGSPYSEGLQQAFAETFDRLGGTIVAQEPIQVGDTEFTALLRRLAAKDLDVLYLPLHVAEGALITRQARAIPKLDGTWLIGSHELLTPEFINAAGRESTQNFYVSAPISTFRADRLPYINDFLPGYRRRFGHVPLSEHSAYAFDAARLVFEAIKKAAIPVPGGGLLIPRTRLRNTLFATRNFTGVTGTLTCDENGDCQPETRIGIYVIDQGHFVKGPPITITVRLEDI